MTNNYLRKDIRHILYVVLLMSVYTLLIFSQPAYADEKEDCEDVVAKSENKNYVIHCRGFLAGIKYQESRGSVTKNSGTGINREITYEPVVFSTGGSSTQSHTIPENFVAINVKPGFQTDLAAGTFDALVFDSQFTQENSTTITLPGADENREKMFLPEQMTFKSYIEKNKNEELIEQFNKNLRKLDNTKAYTIFIAKQP